MATEYCPSCGAQYCNGTRCEDDAPSIDSFDLGLILAQAKDLLRRDAEQRKRLAACSPTPEAAGVWNNHTGCAL
jgi:hypothetical protein